MGAVGKAGSSNVFHHSFGSVGYGIAWSGICYLGLRWRGEGG